MLYFKKKKRIEKTGVKDNKGELGFIYLPIV